MEFDTILKRDNGDQVKITVNLIYPFNRFPDYIVSIWTRSKGKRNWVHQTCTSDYQYLRLPFASKERDEFEYNYQLQFASADEIYAAKINLWESIKPKM